MFQSLPSTSPPAARAKQKHRQKKGNNYNNNTATDNTIAPSQWIFDFLPCLLRPVPGSLLILDSAALLPNSGSQTAGLFCLASVNEPMLAFSLERMRGAFRFLGNGVGGGFPFSSGLLRNANRSPVARCSALRCLY